MGVYSYKYICYGCKQNLRKSECRGKHSPAVLPTSSLGVGLGRCRTTDPSCGYSDQSCRFVDHTRRSLRVSRSYDHSIYYTKTILYYTLLYSPTLYYTILYYSKLSARLY